MMEKITLSIDEMKSKTSEMLGLSEGEDLSFIDEDFLNADAIGISSMKELNLIPNPNYGYQLAYGHRQGVGPTYEFKCGRGGWAPNINSVWCYEGVTRGWLAQSVWDHRNLDSYCVGSGQPAHRQVAEFTFTG